MCRERLIKHKPAKSENYLCYTHQQPTLPRPHKREPPTTTRYPTASLYCMLTSFNKTYCCFTICVRRTWSRQDHKGKNDNLNFCLRHLLHVLLARCRGHFPTKRFVNTSSVFPQSLWLRHRYKIHILQI